MALVTSKATPDPLPTMGSDSGRIIWTVLEYYGGHPIDLEDWFNTAEKLNRVCACLAKNLKENSLQRFMGRYVRAIDLRIFKWFTEVRRPNLSVHYVSTVEKAHQIGGGTEGDVFGLDKNKVAKFPKTAFAEMHPFCANLVPTLYLADKLLRLPPHPAINAFKGVIYVQECNAWGMVFERINGVALDALEKRVAPLSLKERAECLIDIAKGLHHLDQHGFGNDDVRGGNLMVTDKDAKGIIIDIDDLPLAPSKVLRDAMSSNFLHEAFRVLEVKACNYSLLMQGAKQVFAQKGWPGLIGLLEHMKGFLK